MINPTVSPPSETPTVNVVNVFREGRLISSEALAWATCHWRNATRAAGVSWAVPRISVLGPMWQSQQKHRQNMPEQYEFSTGTMEIYRDILWKKSVNSWFYSTHESNLGVSENVVYPIVPNGFADHYPVMKNGYFIGNINPTFSDKPIWFYRDILGMSWYNW